MVEWPVGDGETLALARMLDWRATPLGPIADWSPQLRTIVDLVFTSRLPMFVAAGPGLAMIYNDAYRSFLGPMHPGAFGGAFRTVFADIAEQMEPLLEQVLAGTQQVMDDQHFNLPWREGTPEGWFTAAWTPIRGEQGEIAGFLASITETTDQHRVVKKLGDSERHLAAELRGTELLRNLAERLVTEESSQTLYEEILAAAMVITQSDAGTIQVYDPETQSLVLLVTSGFGQDMTDHFHRVDADSGTACGIALRNGERTYVDFDQERDEAALKHVAAGYCSALATPLLSRNRRPLGMLNTHWRASRHRPDETELRFLDLLARQAADLIEARHAQRALRESEERQAFLLNLSDQLRPLADPVEIQELAARALGQRLGATRVAYVEVIEDHYVIARDYTDGAPSMVGRFPVSEFGAGKVADYQSGETRVVRNTIMDVHNQPADNANFAAFHIRAGIGAPLIKEGDFIATLVVHMDAPRDWKPEEVALVEETAQRTWAAVERARAETALRGSEARLAAAFESVPAGIAVFGTDGRVVLGNEQYRRFLPDGVVASRNPERRERWQAWDKDERPIAPQDWPSARALRGEPVIPGQDMLYTADDGRAIWTNVASAPVCDDAGNVTGCVSVISDVNERKQAEAALRASEERYRSLFETMGQGYAECEVVRDDEGRALDVRYIEVNPSWERLTGLPVADMRGRTAREVVAGLEDWWIEMYDRVVTSGTPERIEHEAAPLGRWFEVQVYPGVGNRFSVLYDDITARKRAEVALRESEERQAFFLRLADALRPIADPSTITETVTRLLGEHLGANRVYYAEWPRGADYAEVRPDYQRDGVSSLAGRYPVEAFRSAYDMIAQGRTWIVENNDTAEGISSAEREYHHNNGVIAWIDVPLTKGGRPIAVLCVVQEHPRSWTQAEIALCEEAAERCWAAIERGRAEAAVRESEERFRQFGRASSDGLWIRDADTLGLQYASDAMEDIYGLSIDAMTEDARAWPAVIVPEDRDETFGYIERVKAGESVVHEFRIQRPTDLQFRWIRSVGFPLLNEAGVTTRIAGISSDITEEKRLAEHQAILLHELQHRVRNIMGIIRSIGNRSASGANSVEDYRATLEGRMLALARVQALLTREANAGGSLRNIIENEVKVQAQHQYQFQLVGPDIMLAPKAVEVLTLAFHELSTNALKYGAFSVPEGRLVVSWKPFQKRGKPWLGLDWAEEGAPQRAASSRRGFGSELIEARIPYELGGVGKITIQQGGAFCRMEFPLKDAESILETDAPMPTMTFGGNIDMTGAADLTGRTVLVVEDDYYMAADTVAALRGAGAEVLGPCPSEEVARDILETATPTHAVLDLNLGGGGPRFEIANLLKDRGIQFIFLTGYDPDIIPLDMMNVVRLQKPVPFRSIVDAISKL